MKYLFFSIVTYLTIGQSYALSVEQYKYTTKFLNEILATKCSNKIFPGLNWKGKYLIFSNKETDLAIEVQVGRDIVKELKTSSLPKKGNYYYHFGHHKGEKATFVSEQIHITEEIEVALHEGFHHFTQFSSGWYKPEGRGIAFPIKGKPRFYRNQISHYLKEAFINESHRDLGKAKYYYQKWKTEYPQEYLTSMDTMEGTAEYFKKMFFVVYEEGCDAGDEVYKQHFIKYNNDIFPNLKIPSVNSNRVYDNEYYNIGFLATAILRFSKDKTWYKKISRERKRVLDILFENVKTEHSIFSEDRLKLFTDFENKYNEKLNPHLAGLDRKLLDTNYIRIEYPLGYYNPFFFGHTMNNTNLIILSGTHDHKRGDSRIISQNNPILIADTSNPCNGSIYTKFILIHEKNIHRYKDHDFETLNINDHYGKGTFLGKTIQKNNFKYFCLNN